MLQKYQKSTEQIIYQFAMAGLIHKYRDCWHCGTRMVLSRRENDTMNYIWECTLCHYKIKLTKNTPVNGINIRSMD
jgi:ribosomal protein L37AE/L43A